MSIQPSVHFDATVHNRTGTEISLSLLFDDKPAWIDAPVGCTSVEYEFNTFLRFMMPSVFNGVRALRDIRVQPDESVQLQWRDAWNVRCLAVANHMITTYVLTMDESFWQDQPAPTHYSYILHSDNGNHVLISDNSAQDACLISFESRKSL